MLQTHRRGPGLGSGLGLGALNLVKGTRVEIRGDRETHSFRLKGRLCTSQPGPRPPPAPAQTSGELWAFIPRGHVPQTRLGQAHQQPSPHPHRPQRAHSRNPEPRTLSPAVPAPAGKGWGSHRAPLTATSCSAALGGILGAQGGWRTGASLVTLAPAAEGRRGDPRRSHLSGS